MIDIYTIKKDSKDWIIYNDLYFNLNTANEEMTEKDIAIIKRADDAIFRQSMVWEQSEIYHQAVKHC